MTSNSLGEGERLQRKRVAIFAVLFVIGMATGGYGAHVTLRGDFDIAAPWSPLASLVFTALYLGAMLVGSLLLSKNIDEIQRDYYYKVGSLAGSIFLILYPTWFMLWKGGFVPEPIHWVLFIVYWLSLVLGMAVYRLR